VRLDAGGGTKDRGITGIPIPKETATPWLSVSEEIPHSHLLLSVQQPQWWTPPASMVHIGQEQRMETAVSGDAPHTTSMGNGQAA
jgi:hypothetical protein